MIKAFEQFRKIEVIIPLINNSIDEMNKILDPMYETAKKTSKIIKRFFYIMDIFVKAQNIIPMIQKLTGIKEKQYDMSI